MNSGPEVKPDPRRSLPAVDRLLRAVEAGDPALPRWAALAGVRAALAAARDGLGTPGASHTAPEAQRAGLDAPQAGLEGLTAEALRHARELARPHPRRVVNATGIVLHTNLGRAPLAAGAAQAAAAVGQSYGDLELDLSSGRRGQRTAAVAAKLCVASDAAGAVVVNNCAAAVMLVLATFARGREVIVSRGELVEIGGAFRVPEILESAGARLVEVGTTNRTHPSDYARAIGPDTALLLKVHRSNFSQQGFVAEVELPALAAIGREHGLPVVEDLGSGSLLDLSAHGFPQEAHAPSRLRLGADLVCFSGDKLLGGPQAGIVLSSDAELAARMERNPLARALRLDKLTLAALDWTLAALLDGRAERELPVLRQLLAEPAALEARAHALAKRLEGILGGRAELAVESDRGFAGGGSLPDFELASFGVTLRCPQGAERLADALRRGEPAVLARIRDGRLWIDVRTLLDGDEEGLSAALAAALR